jgi:hypothetical protein
MSRPSDEELRAAFRARAAGMPHPGLRQRIRFSVLRSQEARVDPVSHEMADRRPILVRVTAIAAVAAVLLVAPLLRAEFEVPPRLGPAPDSPAVPAVGGVTLLPDEDDDRDGDDVGDGEDEVDEADDGAGADDGDDVGDGEDGVDERDDGADEDEGDDDE